MGNKKILLLIVIMITVVAGVLIFILTAQPEPEDITPETSTTVPEIANFLDDQTREALKNNLVNYTGHQLEEFTVRQDSYRENEDGVSFQLYGNDGSLYNIETEPSDDGKYNYVFVTCAPPDEQPVDVNCTLRLEHD